MGRKTASYLLESSEEEQFLAKSKKAQEEYQLSRRINKMSDIELYNFILNSNINPAHFLHASNNQKSWEIIYNEIKPKEKKNKEFIETYKFILKTILEKSDNFTIYVDVNMFINIFIKNISTFSPPRKRHYGYLLPSFYIY